MELIASVCPKQNPVTPCKKMKTEAEKKTEKKTETGTENLSDYLAHTHVDPLHSLCLILVCLGHCISPHRSALPCSVEEWKLVCTTRRQGGARQEQEERKDEES